MATRVCNLANEDGDPRTLSADFDGVGDLNLKYSRTKPGGLEGTTEYGGGRIKVFAVDRFFIECLLEHLQEW